MPYQGDYAAGSIINLKFTTRNTSSTPATLGGTPAVKVYKANSTTETSTGVTLTVDFDAVTGLNHLRIDTSADATFYAAGNDFEAVITSGTVGGASVVGEQVASFSVENRSALQPVTAGRKIAVSSAGGVTLADGVAHGGPPNSSTATLALKQLNLTSDGSAIPLFVNVTGGNQDAVYISASGYGNALDLIGGSDAGAGAGCAIFCQSGYTSDPGLAVPAVYFQGMSSPGLKVEGTSTAHAFVLAATGTGKHDLCLAGSGDIWDGVNGKPVSVRLADATDHGGTLGSSTATFAFSRMVGNSQTTNTPAFSMTGNGTGSGMVLTGGDDAAAPGDGLLAVGGGDPLTNAGSGVRSVGGHNTTGTVGNGAGLALESAGDNWSAVYAHTSFGTSVIIRSENNDPNHGALEIQGNSNGHGLRVAGGLHAVVLNGGGGSGHDMLLEGSGDIWDGINNRLVSVYGAGGGGGGMTVARSNGAFLGTSETVGATINAGTTSTPSEVDVLGNDTSSGVMTLFAVFTPSSTPTRGELTIAVSEGRVTGQLFQDRDKTWSIPLTGMPASQGRSFIGRFDVSRFMKATLKNNSDVNLTNVSLLYTLEKTS